MSSMTVHDEQRLRELATGIAKGVEDDDELLKRLGFTREDYDELAETRTFKLILNQATSEWEGASNTHKRIRLKAAVNVEQALPHFYQAMVDPKEPLSSKVKALEIVARIGNLGNPDVLPPGGGQFFKLEINLGAGRRETVLIEQTAQESYPRELPQDDDPRPRISAVWAGMEKEDL
jgi:hypothetical protein